MTGDYNPLDPYDFYDVPVPANPDPDPNGTKSGAINMGDVLAILSYVGAKEDSAPNTAGFDYDSDKDSNGFKDGRDYDRSPSAPPDPPWGAGVPSGAVNMADVLAALSQVGLSCSVAPNLQLADASISGLVLTLNGTPQTPGSTVTVAPGDLLDAQLTERVDHVGGQTGNAVVKEYVYFKDLPDGTYHCVNSPDAVTKDPSPVAKTQQECTVDGEIVPPSTEVEIPNVDLPVVRPILDSMVIWELLKDTDYTKTVNMVRLGGSTGDEVWETTVGPASGSYPILVCAKEIPEPPAVETDWSDNATCTPYTIVVP
jgi:hypothetical protein